MICEKCGNTLEENESYCSNCGRKTRSTGKTHKGLKRIAAFIAATALAVVTFCAGTEIGMTYAEQFPHPPKIIKIITSAVEALPDIPFEVELNQEKLNAMVSENEELFEPVDNAKLTLSKTDTLIFTGTVERTEAEALFSGKIPSYLEIFLPETVSLYIELRFSDSDDNPDIEVTNLTVAGITFSEEFTDSLNTDKTASDILKAFTENTRSPYWAVEKISVGTGKNGETAVKVKGFVRIGGSHAEDSEQF